MIVFDASIVRETELFVSRLCILVTIIKMAYKVLSQKTLF